MIKINNAQVLTDFKGQPLKQGDQDLTIGDAIAIILAGKTTNPTLGYILGKKFANDKEIELRAEDIVFIKECIEKNEFFHTIVTGQLLEILDPKKDK